MLLSILLLVATAALIVIDQLTKLWAVTQLHNADRVIPVIEGVFEFHYLENPGAAWGMLANEMWFLIPMTILIGTLFLIMLMRSPLRRHAMFSIPCVMIFAGAIGNLIDRIVYGYVVDFLYFKWINFPIFNFADCCVVIGSILLLIYFMFIMKDDDMPWRTMIFGIEKKAKEKENTDG